MEKINFSINNSFDKEERIFSSLPFFDYSMNNSEDENFLSSILINYIQNNKVIYNQNQGNYQIKHNINDSSSNIQPSFTINYSIKKPSNKNLKMYYYIIYN